MGLSRLTQIKCSLALFALLASVAPEPSARAGTPPWPMDPYAHYPQDADVQTVLSGFAQHYSMALSASTPLTRPVRGGLQADTPSAFLDRMGALFGFQWFTQDGVLYISAPAQAETRALRVPAGGVAQLRQALTRLGVFDARFGWGELPEQNVVMVSGPPAYVALIARTLQALPAVADPIAVEVFPLKHAFVTDRVVRYRDRTMVTPGLATTLARLLQQDGGVQISQTGAGAAIDALDDARQTLGVEHDLPAVVASVPPGARSSAAVIEADPRLNALIVRDTADRMPIYRTLIERLDRPVALIHIDAMIVDVNTSRLNELGISWRALAGATHVQAGARALGAAAGSSTAIVRPGSLGLALGSDFAARIDALAQDNDARIQSQASVLTVENLGAVIDLSETVFLETVGERNAIVTPVTVGTSLRVTPRAVAAGDRYEVELSVDIEDGGSQQGQRSDRRHAIRRGTISTLAVVGDAEALLIGGYTQTRRNDEQDKVPFLGDIPLIGALFRSTRTQSQQRERLFILRPSVMAIEGRRVSVRPGFVRDGIEARNDLLEAGFAGTSLPTSPTNTLIPMGTQTPLTRERQ